MGYFVQSTCMSFTMKALAAAALGLNWSNSMVMLYEVTLWLCYGYVMSIMTAASARREAVLWLPCQLGENKCVCSSDGFSSILPASLLKPCLFCSANSVQSEIQQDNWHHQQDQQYAIINWHYIWHYTIPHRSTSFLLCGVCVWACLWSENSDIYSQPQPATLFFSMIFTFPNVVFSPFTLFLVFPSFTKNFNNFSLLYKSEVQHQCVTFSPHSSLWVFSKLWSLTDKFSLKCRNNSEFNTYKLPSIISPTKWLPHIDCTFEQAIPTFIKLEDHLNYTLGFTFLPKFRLKAKLPSEIKLHMENSDPMD